MENDQLVERCWIATVLMWDVLTAIMADETFTKLGDDPTYLRTVS